MTQISSFMGIQTALKGLLAQQRGLDVTSHNVANANTLGYSRQEATMASSASMTIPNGALQNGGGAQLGTGVDVESYRRIRDIFLDVQYRVQATGLGNESAMSEGLQRVELAFAEPGTNGLSAKLSKLWSAFGDLANNPTSTAAKEAVIGQASQIAAAFKGLDAQIAAVGTQAGAEYAALTSATGDVAAYASEIANLNRAIAGSMASGIQPNDLLDRRDVLLDKLSAMGQVSVTDGSVPGQITVRFGDAADPIVDGTTTDWPQTLTNPGGKLGALLELSRSGGTIDSYRDQLDTAAKQLADSINAIHSSGGGGNFFSYTAGPEAASLTVAATTATVRTTTTGAAGGNELALQLAALRGGAPDQSYQGVVTRIGNAVRDAAARTASSQSLVDSVSNRKESISGVSLDEEMTNLLKFQRGYQASSRALSTLDEALDVLINRTGRVGL